MLDVNVTGKENSLKTFLEKKWAGQKFLPWPALCPDMFALQDNRASFKTQICPAGQDRVGQVRAALPCDGLWHESFTDFLGLNEFHQYRKYEPEKCSIFGYVSSFESSHIHALMLIMPKDA